MLNFDASKVLINRIDKYIEIIFEEGYKQGFNDGFDKGGERDIRSASKEDVIKVLSCTSDLGYGIVIEGDTRKVREALDIAIKALEQEPKTGHWVYVDDDDAICGCCNRLNHIYGAYCKHCGARMFEP